MIPKIEDLLDGTVRHTVYIPEEDKVAQIVRILDIGRDREKSKRDAEERQLNWKIYGDAASNQNMARCREMPEIEFMMVTDPTLLEVSTKKQGVDTGKGISCRHCKGQHWTRDCPNKHLFQTAETRTEPQPGSGEYVPVHLRGNPLLRHEDSYAVRISNLPEDFDPVSFHMMVRNFGEIARSHVAYDERQKCKGYAFINYRLFADAEKAVKWINGYGFNNMILSCEHSKPKPRP